MRAIGELTQYLDVAQVALYVFWAFFLVLVLYLNRESRREGYPLRASKGGPTGRRHFTSAPAPKTYKLFHGGETQLPSGKSDDHREFAAVAGRASGDPIEPTGDCMKDGLGAAAWAEREDAPDRLLNGSPRIVPMSNLSDEYGVAEHSTDPRGLRVMASDGKMVGTVSDIWLDCMEMMPRYYDVSLDSGRKVLLPMMLSTIGKSRVGPATGTLKERMETRERFVQVPSILSHQFDDVPALANPVHVTLREEDRISAYYGGGQLHATPDRAEPFL